MKKLTILSIAVMIAVVFAANYAMAADPKVVTAGIKNVATKLDKNGAPYTRLILDEKFTIAGVEVSPGVPALGFSSDLSEDDMAFLAQYKEGDTASLIVLEGTYNGKKSYRILGIPHTDSEVEGILAE